MKKFYLLLLAVLCIPFASNAQFSEDFNSVSLNGDGIGILPTGWTAYDQDGNTLQSQVNWMTNAWMVAGISATNNVAVSTSYYNPAGQSDDWMVTPQINVPSTSTPFLLFKEWNTDPSMPAEYEVLISTAGNTPADFTTVIHSENNPSNTGLATVAVDLSTYAGKQVYIAFRNTTNAGYLLAIDDVEVLSLPDNDLSMIAAELPAYSATNTNNTLKVTVKNLGANVINSMDIEWTDGTNTYTHNVTGLNLQPYKTTTISHSIPVNYTSVVEKNITVSAVNINGGADPNTADNTVQMPFHTVSQVPTKYVVIEEGTGTWCGFCPRGILAMEYMYANPNLFPDFIGIAVHNGDPMVVPEYDNGIDLSGYPGCNVDRVILGASVTQNLWVSFYNSRKDLVAPTEASLTASYDQSTREITASLTADFYTNYAQADIRFSVVVVEDGVTGTTKGYEQVNYYSDSFAQDQGDMGYFDNLPYHVPAADMVYNRVGIALLGGYDGEAGSIASAITDGDTANYTFTYTLPDDVDASEVSLVALILDNKTGAILNAKELDPGLGVIENLIAVKDIQVYPNPSSEFVNVSFGMEMPDNVNLNIYNMTGALVKTQNFQNLNGSQNIQVDISGLSAGEYLLSLSTNDGSVVKNIIVK